jgi:hypothetical protein
MESWMGWAIVVEGLLLSAVLALALTWSVLRAVFHLMPARLPAARLRPALVAQRSTHE